MTFGCAKPRVITETEFINVPEIQYVTPPDAALLDCEISELPVYGDQWLDLPRYIKQKHVEQVACNQRLEGLRQWKRDANARNGAPD